MTSETVAEAESTAREVICDSELLPKPSRDADRLKRDLDEFGYCLLADALPVEQIREATDRIVEQAELEGERDEAMVGDGRSVQRQFAAHADANTPHQIVRSLLNKGKLFRDLVVRPDVLSLMEHMLSDFYILSSTNAIVMRGGSRQQVMHTDQMFVGFPTPVPVTANVLYMVSDFDEARGGTRLVPGSHKWTDFPSFKPVLDDDGNVVDVEQENVQSVAAEGPAGTALVFDGRLWHCGGENVSGDVRLAISTYYNRWFVRQQDLLAMNVANDIYDEMSDELKKLCGFSLMMPGQLGRIEPALGRSNLEVKLPHTGELHR